MLSIHWSHVTQALVSCYFWLFLIFRAQCFWSLLEKKRFSDFGREFQSWLPSQSPLLKTPLTNLAEKKNKENWLKTAFRQVSPYIIYVLYSFYICTQIQVYISINETSVIYTFSFSFLAPLSSLYFSLIHYAQRKKVKKQTSGTSSSKI